MPVNWSARSILLYYARGLNGFLLKQLRLEWRPATIFRCHQFATAILASLRSTVVFRRAIWIWKCCLLSARASASLLLRRIVCVIAIVELRACSTSVLTPKFSFPLQLTTSSKPKGVLIGNAADVEPGKMKEVKVDDKTSLLLVKVRILPVRVRGLQLTFARAPNTRLFTRVKPYVMMIRFADCEGKAARRGLQVHVSMQSCAARCTSGVAASHAITRVLLCFSCSHYKAPMVQGVLSGNHITCPWHAACFDVTTGDIEDGPVFDKLPVFPLTVTKDGSVYAELPADRTKMRSEVPHMCPTSSGDRRNFVIIGSGPAALAAAEALRQEGYAGRITMLTKEASVPYDRVKLSKNLAVTADEAALRPLSFFTEHGISLRTGVVVTEVRTATKEVVLAGGETVRYDKLLAATGGNPRTFRRGEEGAFAHDGGELRNIFPLRDAPHAAIVNELLNSVGPAARVVIIGASFIGMEFAAYLQMNTKIRDITVVAMEEVPFERTMGKTVGTFMMGLHAAKGIKFEMKAQVDCFLGE